MNTNDEKVSFEFPRFPIFEGGNGTSHKADLSKWSSEFAWSCIRQGIKIMAQRARAGAENPQAAQEAKLLSLCNGEGTVGVTVEPLAPYVASILLTRATQLGLTFGKKKAERLDAADGIEVMLTRFAQASLTKERKPVNDATILAKVAAIREPVLASAEKAKEAADLLEF